MTLQVISESVEWFQHCIVDESKVSCVKCDVAHEVHFNEVWAMECMIPSVSLMLMCPCPVSEACTDMIDLSRIPVGTKPVHKYLYFHR